MAGCFRSSWTVLRSVWFPGKPAGSRNSLCKSIRYSSCARSPTTRDWSLSVCWIKEASVYVVALQVSANLNSGSVYITLEAQTLQTPHHARSDWRLYTWAFLRRDTTPKS